MSDASVTRAEQFDVTRLCCCFLHIEQFCVQGEVSEVQWNINLNSLGLSIRCMKILIEQTLSDSRKMLDFKLSACKSAVWINFQSTATFTGKLISIHFSDFSRNFLQVEQIIPRSFHVKINGFLIISTFNGFFPYSIFERRENNRRHWKIEFIHCSLIEIKLLAYTHRNSVELQPSQLFRFVQN